MPRFGVRCRVRFDFTKASKWFTDAELVGQVVGALTSCDFAEAFTHAGRYGAEKPVKGGVAGVARALASKTAGSTSALDAAAQAQATMSAAFDYEAGQFEASVLIADDALAARAASVVDALLGFVVRLIEAFRPHGGHLSNGHIAAEGKDFKHPSPRPPVTHPILKVNALVDVLDERFHASGLDDADPALLGAMLEAPLPATATRTRRDGIVIVRFHTGAIDPESAGRAAGQHAQWLGRALRLPPGRGFNAAGDADETPGQRQPRAPFTFFDPATRRAYKAIIVEPDGEPDRETWDEMVALAKARPVDVDELRLVVPLRELALAILDRARHAGFAAVLYPDDQHRLWNVAPAGWWIGEEAPDPES